MGDLTPGTGGAAAGGGSGSGPAVTAGFDAPSRPAATAKVVSLGTVGRGSKRITLQPTAAAVQQAEKPGPAAGSVKGALPATEPGAPAAKRTLEDLMSATPAAGGDNATGFVAVAVVEASHDEVHQAKKVRTEEPAVETADVVAVAE
jgi:hypothetical protein